MDGNTDNKNTFFHEISEEFALPEQDLRTFTPLTLAFVGDNVYDLIVRTVILCEGNRKLNHIHKEKSDLAKAQTQAKMAELLQDFMTEEERNIYRSGKGAKTATHAKSAGYAEYHKATGLEAVMGYLYLTGNEKRAVELLHEGMMRLAKNP